MLEGEVTFKSEAGEYRSGKGAFVSITKGEVVHHFKNQSDQSAKLLCIVVPAGVDAFFVEAAEFMEVIYKQPSHSDSEVKEEMKRISEK